MGSGSTSPRKGPKLAAMATLAPVSFSVSPDLLPSGELWLPRASLVSCLRAVIVRSTLGTSLNDAQRINRFPASPMCSLCWFLEGEPYRMLPANAAGPTAAGCCRVPMPGRWVVGGPQTRPTASWSPGPVHGMMVLVAPDAFLALTGLAPESMKDQLLDAAAVLPVDWRALDERVRAAPDDASRIEAFEAFIEPRWSACRPDRAGRVQRYADWATHLAQRAVVSGPGRSLRQLERRIKRWAGLPMRELQGFGRAERAFFEAKISAGDGDPDWADLAADTGYADQAHLSRISRRITGYSPKALYDGIRGDESFWIYRLWT